MSLASLATTLLADLTETDGAEVAALAALTAAASSWPLLPKPDSNFVTRVREHLQPGPAAEALAAIDLGELLLAHHAMLGNAIAVHEVRVRLEALQSPLRRTGASTTEIDELLTDLLSDLLAPRAEAAPRIAAFAGRCSLTSWIRVIAVRTMVDRRRKRGEVLNDDVVAEAASTELDPELELLKRTYAREFREAFAAAMSELAPIDRALLRQHHLDGVGLDALARLHAVHRATIARKLASTRQDIFARVRRRLLHDLRIGNETVDSILRLVQGEMDVSLIRLL
jgi:RNA polymerase sigma-70 factor, ECF subfamily